MSQNGAQSQIKFNSDKVSLVDFSVKLDLTKMSETFGQWLSAMRIKRGLNQTELAERSRTTKATISLLEADKIAQPRLDNIDNIAKALDVPIKEIRQVFADKVVLNKTESKKIANVAEFFEALDTLGLNVQFDGGYETLSSLGPDDLQDILDSMIGTATAKARRKKKQ